MEFDPTKNPILPVLIDKNWKKSVAFKDYESAMKRMKAGPHFNKTEARYKVLWTPFYIEVKAAPEYHQYDVDPTGFYLRKALVGSYLLKPVHGYLSIIFIKIIADLMDLNTLDDDGCFYSGPAADWLEDNIDLCHKKFAVQLAGPDRVWKDCDDDFYLKFVCNQFGLEDLIPYFAQLEPKSIRLCTKKEDGSIDRVLIDASAFTTRIK